MNENGNVIALPGCPAMPGDDDADGVSGGRFRRSGLALARSWRLPGWWPPSKAEVRALQADVRELMARNQAVLSALRAWDRGRTA